MNTPQLVAHRGYPKRFPENTLESIAAALKAGATFVEFDIQVTADGIPVLMHDVSLMRTTGQRGRIVNLSYDKIASFPANEPKRFGKRYRTVTIPRLTAAVELLRSTPHVTAMVELKVESLEAHGWEKVVKRVISDLEPILDQTVIISYDILALRCARAMGIKRVGWVMEKWSEASKAKATELVPDYLICNYTKLPKAPAPLWYGPWQWMVYEVTQPKLAMALAERGADLVETMAIGEMLKSKRLRGGTRIVN